MKNEAKYLYKDFTGLYYAGSHVGWANLGGSAWVRDITKAKPLSLDEAQRVARSISGSIIERDE